jgi:hypothetical protein
LVTVHQKQPALAETYVSRLAESTHVELREVSLEAAQWMVEGAANPEALLDVAHRLSRDPALRVRAAAAGVLRRFATHSPSRALDILASIEWDGESWLAEAILGILDSRFGLDPEKLDMSQVDDLLAKVGQLHRLEGRNYEVLQFIAFASEKRPTQTIEMLLRRIKAIDERDKRTDRWIPLPYNGRGLSLEGIHKSPNHHSLVRLIRDASLNATTMLRFWLPVLFKAADPKLEAGRVVLGEWIDSGEPEKIASAASLLRGFDHSVVFSEHSLISDLLMAASRRGGDCLEDTKSELFALANSGVYTGIPGEPAPRHLQDKAEASRLADVHENDAPVRDFYRALVAHAEANIRLDVALDVEEDGE